MRVNEVFYSIQGEGLYAGLPMVFLRLQGCNLSCSYCDTTYAQSFKGGRDLSIKNIVEEITKWHLATTNKRVCITGGEPLAHQEVEELVNVLKQQEWWIEVETNGSVPPPDWYTRVDSWVPDIKCPSSGMSGKSKNDWFNLRRQDQIKFVVGTEEDLEFTRTVLAKHMDSRVAKLVSPVWTEDTEWLNRVVEFCKEWNILGVRLSLQLHKVLWGNKKGV